MSVIRKVQVRRGTAAAWSSANPVLSAGEFGYDETNDKVKIGDGVTAWNSLPFAHYKPIEVDALLDDVPKLDEVNTFTTRQKIRGVIDAYVGENVPQAPSSYTEEQKDSFIGGWQFRTNGGAFPWYDSIYPDNIAGFGWNINGTVYNEPRMILSFESAFRAGNGNPDMFEWNLDYVMQDGSLFRQMALAGPRAAPNQATKDNCGVAWYGNVFYIGSYDSAATTNPEFFFDMRGTGDDVFYVGNGSSNTYINLRKLDAPVIRQWVGGTDYVGIPHIERITFAQSENVTTFSTARLGKKVSTMMASMFADANASTIAVGGTGFSATLGAYVSGLSILDTRGLFWVRDEVGAYITHSNGVGTSFGRASYAISFFQATPVFRQTVSGSRGGNAALESLLTALANYGLITNSTSA